MTAAANASPWIRRFHPSRDAPVRLVCFPHSGGSATFYFPFSKLMAPSVDVLAIQYPGRQDRRTEKCLETIGELADRVADELRVWTDAPLALFGHSMGATVAFEVARRLQHNGVSPLGLVTSGQRAPSRHRHETAHLLDDDGLVAGLRQLSATDSQVLGDEEILRVILPTLRSDYKAAETYRYQPGPALGCPILSLVGDNDPLVTVAEAQAWRDHTASAFELQVFSGGHFYLNSYVTTVTNTISERIGELFLPARAAAMG